jgi:hypothetical protein
MHLWPLKKKTYWLGKGQWELPGALECSLCLSNIDSFRKIYTYKRKCTKGPFKIVHFAVYIKYLNKQYHRTF